MNEAARKLAGEISRDSIVTQALQRYTEQVVETVAEHKDAEIKRLREALRFYANHSHWMTLTSDSENALLLCAMSGPSPFHGYSVAERALSPAVKEMERHD